MQDSDLQLHFRLSTPTSIYSSISNWSRFLMSSYNEWDNDGPVYHTSMDRGKLSYRIQSEHHLFCDRRRIDTPAPSFLNNLFNNLARKYSVHAVQDI
ncbi:hypothetical protein CEXT_600051 [Caerostris extrusa]|uniref:Uncharacterized protein n=1 Tax=Caerostris extrusa TaxID=172846 RepID=A0AAV4RJN0_CAEEX|nr:hypothetical protein CEXT_600051 [Caerostris extrusa]